MQPLFGNTAIWSKQATQEIFSVAHKGDRILLILGGLGLLGVGGGLLSKGAVAHAVVFFVLGVVLFVLGTMAPAIYLARQTHKYRFVRRRYAPAGSVLRRRIYGESNLRSLHSGPHGVRPHRALGGNATLFLPVHRPGKLLCVG